MNSRSSWGEIFEHICKMVLAYVVVYIILQVYTMSTSFEDMVMLALAFLIVDVTIIKASH